MSKFKDKFSDWTVGQYNDNLCLKMGAQALSLEKDTSFFIGEILTLEQLYYLKENLQDMYLENENEKNKMLLEIEEKNQLVIRALKKINMLIQEKEKVD